MTPRDLAGALYGYELNRSIENVRIHAKRAKPTPTVEKEVLVASKRRCCLCYYLSEDRAQKRGQLAHLKQDASSSTFDDLVWLCLEHHDEFDSQTRQSKNFTRAEVQHYRDRLYRELGAAPRDAAAVTAKRAVNLVSERFSPALLQVIEKAKGRFGYFAEPWRPIVWDGERGRLLFAYKSPNRFDGICWIERLEAKDGRTVIICQQPKENPGISITNAVEEIAFQVCGWYGIDPARLVWIEHYPGETAYLQVRFAVRPPKGMFADPEWSPMHPDDWRALGLRPRVAQITRRTRLWPEEVPSPAV